MKSEEELSRPMTVAECERKHRPTWALVIALLSMMVLFSVAVVWAVGAGYYSQTQSVEVRHALDKHLAEEAITADSIDKSLLRIETTLKDQREELKEQRKMIEDLWKSNGQ